TEARGDNHPRSGAAGSARCDPVVARQHLHGKVKPKNGRRRRRRTRGTWRPGGPGRPPKAVAEKMAHTKRSVATPVAPKPKIVRRRRRRRRGPGRPPGSKKEGGIDGDRRSPLDAVGDPHPSTFTVASGSTARRMSLS